MCVLCFCLLALIFLYLAFKHVCMGAIDLGRALESWAPWGDPWRIDLGMIFMHLETGICLGYSKESVSCIARPVEVARSHHLYSREAWRGSL